MTKFLKTRQLYVVLAISVFAIACNDDDSKTDPPVAIEKETIYDSASLIPGLSNLLTAVNSANGDFESVLDGSNEVTLLAPSNDAFEALATKLGYADFQEMITDIDKDVLADILSYHILTGTNNTSSLSGEVNTDLGETLTFGTNDDDQTIAEDKTELPSTNTAGVLVGPNQPRVNGVIHTVNKVLLPQSIIDLYNIDIRPNLYELADYEGYTSLIAAVDKAEVKATLEGSDLSFFVPSNEAVSELFDFLGDDYESLDDFDNSVEIQVLKDILTYHLFQPETAAAELEVGPIQTLLEDNIVTITGGGESSQIEDYSATDATIEVPEIGNGAVNGTAYAIDKVLLPQPAFDFINLLASPDLLETVSNEATLSALEEAVTFLDLEEDLNDITNVSIRPQGEDEEDEDYQEYLESVNPGFTYYDNGTIFAPSDAAFQDLFDLMGPNYNSIADFDTEEEMDILMDIVLYHIVSGSIMADNLSAGELTTEEGSVIKVTETLEGDIILENSEDNINASIITADISARNGVIHIIDKVLLPKTAIEFINSIED